MVRWLCEQGLDAQSFATEYGDDEESSETDTTEVGADSEGSPP